MSIQLLGIPLHLEQLVRIGGTSSLIRMQSKGKETAEVLKFVQHNFHEDLVL